jgi:CHAD domain-containing protein
VSRPVEEGEIDMSDEREAKLIASAQVQLPDLDGLVDGASTTVLDERRLEATYYDTAELDLARWGITLRHRSGEDGPPWTLKLPGGQSGPALVRRELTFDGSPSSVPAAARDLVRAHLRSRRLVRVARLHTDRSPLEIRDPAGQRLAEIVDDRVTVHQGPEQTGEFREVEVEVLVSGRVGDQLLAGAVDRLLAAGCSTDPPIPKVVRALGQRALEPPELTVRPVRRKATVVELIRHALARSVLQMIRCDPGVRLGEDPDDVHQFRVATRRLRSDLHTFAPLLEPGPLQELRDELRWVGAAVGAVRDNDVLAQRLRSQAEELPEPDAAGVQPLVSLLAGQAAAARAAMLRALRSRRYVALIDTLIATANEPPIRPERAARADQPARRAAARYVRRPWRRLRDAIASLDDDPPDSALHNVRILAKRCRYAAEAVAPGAGRPATRFAAAVADLQTVLGDHQDTIVAEAWLRNAAATTFEGALAAGELILLQRWQRARLRAGWPTAWKTASAKDLRSWL